MRTRGTTRNDGVQPECGYASVVAAAAGRGRFVAGTSAVMALVVVGLLGLQSFAPVYLPQSAAVTASFVRDTPVVTADGPVRIEEIEPGTQVYSYSHDEDGWVLRTVTDVVPTYHDQMMLTEITVGGEVITASAHHPVFVTSGSGLRGRLLDTDADPPGITARGWIRAGDLEEGDALLARNGSELVVDNVYTRMASSLLYDLRVDAIPSFAVGEIGMLVGDETLVPEELFQPPQPEYSAGGACFLAGTSVAIPGGTAAIERLAAGDTVRSYDPVGATWTEHQVTALHVHEYAGEFIRIATGTGAITATANHPFLARSTGALTATWVAAGSLIPGDSLMTAGGSSTITAVQRFEAARTVYNITVASTHTYAVGSAGFVVHNKGGAEVMESAAPLDSMPMAAEPAPMASESMADAPSAPEPSPAVDDGAPAPGQTSRSEQSQTAPDEQLPVAPEAQEMLYLSADDSNSTASPAIVRSLINAGRYVPPSLVRTYEFYNYYSFGYPAPNEGELGISANLAPNPGGGYSVQAVLRSPDRSYSDLPPLHVVFLLDTSGSMAGEPFDIARQFIYEFIEFLRPGDTIAVVGTSRYARVLVDQYQVNRGTADYVRERLSPLVPNDITNLDPGIGEAYRIAEQFQRYDGLTRVVVISDGGANAGDFTGNTISHYAQDAQAQGIYLTGVGVGQGFNDDLMNDLTDSGRGAYFFLDSPEEIDHILGQFLNYFDLAFADVRLGMQMPPGWSVRAFFGEQMSTVKEDVIPQYLAPNDQMIFQMQLDYAGNRLDDEQVFAFHAEYTPIAYGSQGVGEAELLTQQITVAQMRSSSRQLAKAEALTVFAEGLKQIRYPLIANRAENVAAWLPVVEAVSGAAARLGDSELDDVAELARAYQVIVENGEQFTDSLDEKHTDVAAVLGIPDDLVRHIRVSGPAVQMAVQAISQLGSSVRLKPTEGFRMLGLSTGPVGNPSPVGSGQLSGDWFEHPVMEYMGSARYYMSLGGVYDKHMITLELTAPPEAQSFSFDFNFFSAEYPDFINQSFNDSFYAILEAQSTNQGAPTNISFDPDQNPIEVDNNYFQRRYHPLPNTGTGFDSNGSTGWLRTSWPIEGGEQFTLTFTIHDEGDAIFDSMTILDNVQFHAYPAVGTTDPLN